MHEGKKQFKCDICEAEFGQKVILNRHVATVHEGKKPFKCEICDARLRFGYKCALNRHVATAHKGKKQFKCDICYAKYKSANGLSYHRKSVHKINKL